MTKMEDRMQQIRDLTACLPEAGGISADSLLYDPDTESCNIRIPRPPYQAGRDGRYHVQY